MATKNVLPSNDNHDSECIYCYEKIEGTISYVEGKPVCSDCHDFAIRIAKQWYRCVSNKGHQGWLIVGRSYKALIRVGARCGGVELVPSVQILDSKGAVNTYPLSLFMECEAPAKRPPMRVNLDVPL